ncbi:MAG: Uma2 family endonuclease [Chloroflexota bacterium]|nr:Uma2 family endonuclease [Chloroflexota bacterium]MDE2683186.1 Uma2 family endonuclease [Chloroflexota bacterium]
MTTTIEPRTGMQFSVAEFLELDLPEPDDKRKMELDDGILYIMPRPRIAHQRTQGKLIQYFFNYQDLFDEPPCDTHLDVIVALPSELPRLFAPDLSVILRGNDVAISDRMIEGAPDIAVEVLSSDRNRDLVRKRQVYAEAGIPEYWIFDERNEVATLLELRDGEYVERTVLTADDTLTTPLLPGLEIPLAGIFRLRTQPAR